MSHNLSLTFGLINQQSESIISYDFIYLHEY